MSNKEKVDSNTAEKMDIMTVRIDQLTDLVRRSWYARRSPDRKPGVILGVIGDAGIGKTQVVEDAGAMLAKELKKPFEVRVSMTSTKLPEDYAGIPVPDKEKKIIEFYKMKELPREGNGIYFFDEFNRAADSGVLKVLVRFLSSYAIDDYVLPDGWSIVVAINPEDDVYNVCKIEPALRRRISWVHVTTDQTAFLNYAKGANIHPAVTNYIRNHPKALLNLEALRNGKVFSNPAAYEKVSHLIDACLKDEEEYELVAPLVSGLIGLGNAKQLGDEYRNYAVLIDPADVLFDWPKVEPKIKKLCKEGKADLLTELIAAVIGESHRVDVTDKNKIDTAFRSTVKLYKMLPDELSVVYGKNFLVELDKIQDSSVRWEWLNRIGEDPEMRERMVELGKKEKEMKKVEEKKSKKKDA